MERFLLLIALAGLVLLHLWWRKRFMRAGETFRRDTEELRAAHQRGISAMDTRQKALLDSMVEGLVVLDENGRISVASRAFQLMFGTPSDLCGKTLIEAVRSHDLAGLAGILDREKQIDGHELKLAGAGDAGDRWIGVSGAALFTANGLPSGKLLVFHDLTRIKKLERTRQEFVANVSHELRTPLSLIKGYAETLLDGAKDQPDVALKFLQSIDRNAERLKLLIEDLLTISELESKRSTLNFQAVSAHALAAKVVADLAERANAREIQIINNVPELTVLADPGRMEQVLVNLTDNAIKYGNAGGIVEISAKAADGNLVEFTVRDDGPGIAPEALERIFERFYREDKARAREQGGTGLGLAIVKHIVQSHHGQVWANSQPGHGSTFHFTLPAHS